MKQKGIKRVRKVIRITNDIKAHTTIPKKTKHVSYQKEANIRFETRRALGVTKQQMIKEFIWNDTVYDAKDAEIPKRPLPITPLLEPNTIKHRPLIVQYPFYYQMPNTFLSLLIPWLILAIWEENYLMAYNHKDWPQKLRRIADFGYIFPFTYDKLAKIIYELVHYDVLRVVKERQGMGHLNAFKLNPAIAMYSKNIQIRDTFKVPQEIHPLFRRKNEYVEKELRMMRGLYSVNKHHKAVRLSYKSYTVEQGAVCLMDEILDYNQFLDIESKRLEASKTEDNTFTLKKGDTLESVILKNPKSKFVNGTKLNKHGKAVLKALKEKIRGEFDEIESEEEEEESTK
jgi:hypothetical protein